MSLSDVPQFEITDPKMSGYKSNEGFVETYPGVRQDDVIHNPILEAGQTDLDATRKLAAELGLSDEQTRVLFP